MEVVFDTRSVPTIDYQSELMIYLNCSELYKLP
jgi:hypothetical protein